MNLETLKQIESAASPAPWKPNCVHETEGDGAWGAGPLCEPSEPEDVERLESGDWDMEAQMELATGDATLIATARNLLPEMLAVIEAAEGFNYPITGSTDINERRRDEAIQRIKIAHDAFSTKLAAL